MHSDQFWTSQDGEILTIKKKDARTVKLKLAFSPRTPAELDFFKTRTALLNFTERSTLARIGIEMFTIKPVSIEAGRFVVTAEAFLYDDSFPNAGYWAKLLRPGTPVGRLFYAPEKAKLSTAEIWEAVQTNRLKLPNTISIDRLGRVFLTPHHVRYTLNPRLKQNDFERLTSGEAGRNYLDKVQVRHDTHLLTIEPSSGVLTSCSMYLKEHYVLLNRGEGNFGIHTSAVLLDPIKTFGTNIMLEIYNTGTQPVVNPMVSVEIFRAPPSAIAGNTPDDPEFKSLRRRRTRLLTTATDLFECIDANPPKTNPAARPRTRITVKGQSASMENFSLLLNTTGRTVTKATLLQKCGYRTMVESLAAAPAGADTLLIDYFPNLLEHIELLTRLPELKLRRIIFRQPSRTHGFFLSNNAHGRLESYHDLGIDVYWFNVAMKDLYRHTYKKSHGFFVREELRRVFQESTILAFYGSAVGLEKADTDRISGLIDKLTGFIGPNVGVLTGGGGGVMRLATDQARNKGALTGACFLELEAQPPELGVDFFNTFQETARHYRQKWFEVADFCVFNVGGVGTLEEIGIELCNLKLGIRPRVPYVFFNSTYWADLRQQLEVMVQSKRMPAWVIEYILFTDDPDEVVAFYRKTLQVL
ncbi:LOG family protein [Rariglobus hedericola]|uniref:AMP nucleosidase n=1 Tax=Rariglobus hedericola TaxID=2597822 RepID=A0A556QES2_9BACT|nr:LOG family protein [Rariglobus hedericola]TSJ75117.1 DNA-binding protein [Rariglobus hedericola]